jgi:16S rRNA (adenine(1408)-N(1))-methyltransferase
VVDLGTGDGRFVLRTADREPAALVIGVDADAASMVEASRRAWRTGTTNALFVVAPAERLPVELDGCADEVRIHFPWGSLLRGILAGDQHVMDPISRLCAPTASVSVLLSVVERDHVDGSLDVGVVSRGFERYGFRSLETRPATDDDIAAAHSSWAKRLRAGSRRPVSFLRFVREPSPRTTC